MSNDRLDYTEVSIIVAHNQRMIDACDAALEKYKLVPKALRSEHILRTIQYWKDAKSALSWSNGIARQRMKRKNNVNRSTV